MHPDEHPVIARTRTTIWQKLGFAVVVLGVAAGFAGLGLALSAKDEAGQTAERIRNFRPCVDASEARAGVQLSEGCRVLFRNLARLCARSPGFCRRSQQLAVKEAQNQSAEKEIGPTASLRGGGSSKGKPPNSKPSPRQPPEGDGDNGGGQPGQPTQPTPGQPDPSTPSPGRPDNVPPADEPLIQVPPVVPIPQPVCDTVEAPLGGVIRICP